MELSELTVASFTNLLASNAPAPGGGSTAALEGALGVSLSAMVSAVTVGRKKYAEFEELAKEVQAKADRLKDSFLVAMERDTAAFNMFGDAMALPKETAAQKAVRSEAMQAALVACIESPLNMMELCLEAMQLAKALLGKSNANALSDLGVSALSLTAAVRGAWLNVLINLSGLKDADAALRYRIRAEEFLGDTVALGEEIYRTIETSL